MDACMAVDREVDKVLSKFGSLRQNFNNSLQKLIDNLESINNNLQTNPDENKELTFALLKLFIDKSKKETQKLTSEHKGLHSSISKIGKSIDKNFVSDFSSTCKDNILGDPENTIMVNKIICQHFHREGMLNIANEFSQESGTEMESSIKEQYAKFNYIKERLQNKDIYPALEWVKENKSLLETRMYPNSLVKKNSSMSNLPIRIPYHKTQMKCTTNIMKPRPKTKKIKRLEHAQKILQQFYKSSSLEFKLHKIEFLSIIQKGTKYQSKAVLYARSNFGQFANTYEKEIQTLMGMLLYVQGDMNQSPYANVIQDNIWKEVNELFIRDACILQGLSFDSLLNVSVNAGCIALPALLNINHVLANSRVVDILKDKDELPIEIQLDSEHRYHSMFACPILRQQSSNSNPPMRLICGHIISKDALIKLGTPNKLKCPYCPMEQSLSEAKRIFF